MPKPRRCTRKTLHANRTSLVIGVDKLKEAVRILEIRKQLADQLAANGLPPQLVNELKSSPGAWEQLIMKGIIGFQ